MIHCTVISHLNGNFLVGELVLNILEAAERFICPGRFRDSQRPDQGQFGIWLDSQHLLATISVSRFLLEGDFAKEAEGPSVSVFSFLFVSVWVGSMMSDEWSSDADDVDVDGADCMEWSTSFWSIPWKLSSDSIGCWTCGSMRPTVKFSLGDGWTKSPTGSLSEGICSCQE